MYSVHFDLFNFLNTSYELTRSWKIELNFGIIQLVYIVIIYCNQQYKS